MAAALRSRSPVAALLALALGAVVLCHFAVLPQVFVPAPLAATEIISAREQTQAQGALVAALAAAAAAPQPAMAIRGGDDDEGFDVRIIAVLALPLLAVSWALFNVWRVAFRQVVRIGESTKGNAK
eukprot:gb/GFBE01027104.1/.p1 GENE.gb/GFBE01027104.1/~~gb/GFBE01027104.1/.p1  ORF type:complete len:126 (+),score=33.38 gb/GFBE01027104.1/:1-378(+)